jgi:hypothetical protein
MHMISIEVTKDVPIPESKRRYPYVEMQVGDSFVVVGGRMQIVCNANYRAGKRLGRRFIARREEGGVRVWRTS